MTTETQILLLCLTAILEAVGIAWSLRDAHKFEKEIYELKTTIRNRGKLL
jgi:hypothetical protein